MGIRVLLSMLPGGGRKPKTFIKKPVHFLSSSLLFVLFYLQEYLFSYGLYKLKALVET